LWLAGFPGAGKLFNPFAEEAKKEDPSAGAFGFYR
jgi:hypothetical protein